MKRLLRLAASAPKQHHTDAVLGLTLDLSYITPRLIVCAGPVDLYLQSWYRCSVANLVQWLDIRHANSWHIWNFRGEGAGYGDEAVGGNVSHFPFPDHQAPTMGLLMLAVLEMDRFLQASSSNVCVLHCKAGKGRSGTVACAYLVLKGYAVKQALDVYTQARMYPLAGAGVSIASQVRYLHYWQRYWAQPLVYLQDTAVVTIGTVIADSHTNIHLALQCYDDNHQLQTVAQGICIGPVVVPQKDVRVVMNRFYYFWFNAHYEGNSFSILWADIDGFKGTSLKGTRLFDTIKISWTRSR